MFTAKRFSGVEVFINLLLKKRGEGGKIHSVDQILVKSHLKKKSCICIKNGMWGLSDKVPRLL